MISQPNPLIKPLGLTKPVEPDLDDMKDADFNEKSTRYKYVMSKYKTKLLYYEKEQNAIAKIITHIYDKITVKNLIYIEKIEVHS